MENNEVKEKKDGKIIFPLLIIITIVLLVVFGACIILAIYYNDFTMIDYISVTSSFSVAILTVIYVYASTKQMHVMKLQLDEMKTEHLLKDHPILVLDQPKLCIEFPRFYYSPPQDQFSFQSRYFFTATLANASDDPAIIVSLVTKILIPDGDQELILHSSNHRANLISAKEKQNNIRMLFIDDLDGKLFNALRDKDAIRIQTEIYYQNISGACFSTHNTYRFYLSSLELPELINNPEKDASTVSIPDVIRNWHTIIVQAPTKYKEQLRRLKSIVHEKKQRKEYETIFESVKSNFSADCISSKNLDCYVYEINGKFEIKTITPEEFTKNTDNSLNIKKIMAAVGSN